MRRQTSIVIGFLDQVLRPRPLAIESHHRVNRRLQIGDEHPIAVFRGVEQLVLLGIFAFLRLRFLHVSQGYESVGLPPSLWLIAKLALAVGIGSWRPGPACSVSQSFPPTLSRASSADF